MRTCKTRPLTADETARLIRVLPIYWKHVIVINLATGLRISDLLQLKRDLSFPVFRITERKTGKIRQIKIPDWAFDSWLYLRENADIDGYLLVFRNSSTYRRAIKRFCLLAKIDPFSVSWHSIRKTVANIVCSQKGIQSAQLLLNHSNPETTKAYLDDESTLVSNMVTDAMRGIL